MNQRAQAANAVLMVPPDDFGFNEQTARDNEFQHPPEAGENWRQKVASEFEATVTVLRDAGVEVVRLPKNPALPALPDAVFPNNWFSTWPDGRVYLYPMRTSNRQAEVRPKDLHTALEGAGYRITDIHTVSHAPGQALEGTGALIFDHLNNKVYAALSERCDSLLVQQHVQTLGYRATVFETCSSHGRPFYHSNVMMSVGEQFALVCSEAVVARQRGEVLQQLRADKRDVIEVTLAQAEQAFCANILQLRNRDGDPVIAMSASALAAFNTEQKAALGRHGQLLALPVTTIEHMGGGSARCMLAEIFLPKR